MSNNELNKRMRILTDSIVNLANKLDAMGDQGNVGAEFDAKIEKLGNMLDDAATLQDQLEGRDYPGLQGTEAYTSGDKGERVMKFREHVR